jgi:hypothetical protein
VLITRYCVVLRSALAALLLIAAWSLPEPPTNFPDRPDIIERTPILITAERKWPEAVVLDTNQPTFSPMPIEIAPAEQPVEPRPDEMTDQTSVDTWPNQIPVHGRSMLIARPREPGASMHRAFLSTHVAKTRNRNEQRTFGSDERCCQFEWADEPAISRTAARKRVARRDSGIGWHLPEAN